MSFWVVCDFDTGRRLPGRVTSEVRKESLAAPSGAVPAYCVEGWWHYVPPCEVEHYRRNLREEVVTVYAEDIFAEAP